MKWQACVGAIRILGGEWFDFRNKQLSFASTWHNERRIYLLGWNWNGRNSWSPAMDAAAIAMSHSEGHNSPSMVSRWRGADSQGLSSEEGCRWAVGSEGNRSRSLGRMSVWLLQWLLTSWLTWMHFSFLLCKIGMIRFPRDLFLAMVTSVVGHHKCQWLFLLAAQEAKWLLEKGNIPRTCSCETPGGHIPWSYS